MTDGAFNVLVLKNAGLIRGEVDGPRVYCCIHPEPFDASRRSWEGSDAILSFESSSIADW